MVIDKAFKSVVIPFVIALLVFLFIRPAFAQLIARDVQLAQSLEQGNIQVGVETVDGYSQVYYISSGKKVFITSGVQNSRMPAIEGQYLVYVTNINGAGQIFLHNITADTTIQITNSGTNLKPKVDKFGHVVWERWIRADETWQIFLFDGITTRQITSGDLSINADIEGDFIVYAQKDSEGVWKAKSYSLIENKETTINVGSEYKFPELSDGQILFDNPGQGKFSEQGKVGDIFLIDSQEVPDTPTEVTEEEIIRELEPTPTPEAEQALEDPSQEVLEEGDEEEFID